MQDRRTDIFRQRCPAAAGVSAARAWTPQVILGQALDVRIAISVFSEAQG